MRDSLRMAVRIATNLTLPPDLVAEIDAVAGRRNRSAFAEEALRRALKREQSRLAIERTAGAWSAEEYPEFATSEMVVEWVRAQRSEGRDPWAPQEP